MMRRKELNDARLSEIQQKALTQKAAAEPSRPDHDVIKEDSAILLLVDLPGVLEQDVSIEIQKSRLIIKGRYPEPLERAGRYLHHGRRTGSFHLEFLLPEQTSGVYETLLQNGVLQVRLPFPMKVQDSAAKMLAE